MKNIFGIHEHALGARIKRAQLIANNIVNSETPGYQAKDLDFKAFLERSLQSQDQKHTKTTHIRTTDPRHIKQELNHSSFSDLKNRVNTHPALDGNTVDTHLEKSAFLENAMHLQASLRFINGRISGIINALKGESS